MRKKTTTATAAARRFANFLSHYRLTRKRLRSYLKGPPAYCVGLFQFALMYTFMCMRSVAGSPIGLRLLAPDWKGVRRNLSIFEK